MKRDEAFRKARREVGLPSFEQNCRCDVFNGRRQKAYRIPGTRESGRHAMLVRRASEIADRLVASTEQKTLTAGGLRIGISVPTD